MSDFLYEYRQADLSTMMHFTGSFKIGWHFSWYALRQADISGQTLANRGQLFAEAVALQISKTRSFKVLFFFREGDSFILQCISFTFLCLQGPTSGHVKLIVDRLLRRVNRTVINLSLDSPFIVRHKHGAFLKALAEINQLTFLPKRVLFRPHIGEAHTHLLKLITTTVCTTELNLFMSSPRLVAVSFLSGVGSTCKVIDYFFSSSGHRATIWHAWPLSWNKWKTHIMHNTSAPSKPDRTLS